MVAWKSVLVVALLVGCSERNKNVCCLTAADCESLGLSADDVGNRGCRDGESCVDLTCVPTPPGDDADVDSSGAHMDAPSGRCDPMKDFAPATRVPNVNSGFVARHFVLSSDELTAYIVRQTTSNNVVTSTTRGSTTEDFPVDTDDPFLAPASHSDEVWPSRQRLVLYHRRLGVVNVSERTTTTEAFPSTREVLVGGTGDPLPSGSHLVGVNGDATELYFTQSDTFLYEADTLGPNFSFQTGAKIAPMQIASAVLTADELTLYYIPPGGGAGIYVSTRTDTHAMFPQGTTLPSFELDDIPFYITADQCELYLGGSRSGVGGVFVARRPL